jgi:hypothetical protein
MEILTFVLKGALSHKDSLGSGSTIRPGQLQGMRAGSGSRIMSGLPRRSRSRCARARGAARVRSSIRSA